MPAAGKPCAHNDLDAQQQQCTRTCRSANSSQPRSFAKFKRGYSMKPPAIAPNVAPMVDQLRSKTGSTSRHMSSAVAGASMTTRPQVGRGTLHIRNGTCWTFTHPAQPRSCHPHQGMAQTATPCEHSSKSSLVTSQHNLPVRPWQVGCADPQPHKCSKLQQLCDA